MSQHDFDIANQGFPATRADLNNALKAAVSNSAGTSAPSTTYAYQFWYDSTNNIIKMRNGDNDAWISVATVDQTNDLVSITHTGMLDLVDDDGSASIRFQAPSTVTSTTTFTLPDGDGESGQTLITNGSGTLAWAAPYGNRNLIINGAMQVAQRGTSTAGGGFLVDRFELNINNTDNIAITQSQDSSGPSGFANSWKILATTAESAVAADERVRFRQNIEGQNLQQFAFGTSAAKSMTLSFYVKSNVTGTYAVNLEQDDASRVIGSTYTISSADTWEFKTITVGGDTSGTINDDNGAGLVVSWYLLAGSNYTGTDNTSYGASADGKQAYGHTADWGQDTNDNFFITGVQLEVGQATPFEHRSFADELARCQRYFEKIEEKIFGSGVCQSSLFISYLPYAITKRTIPSFSSTTASDFSVWDGSTSRNATALAIGSAMNVNAAEVRVSVSGLTAGKAGVLNNSDGEITFDAEL